MDWVTFVYAFACVCLILLPLIKKLIVTCLHMLCRPFHASINTYTSNASRQFQHIQYNISLRGPSCACQAPASRENQALTWICIPGRQRSRRKSVAFSIWRVLILMMELCSVKHPCHRLPAAAGVLPCSCAPSPAATALARLPCIYSPAILRP